MGHYYLRETKVSSLTRRSRHYSFNFSAFLHTYKGWSVCVLPDPPQIHHHGRAGNHLSISDNASNRQFAQMAPNGWMTLRTVASIAVRMFPSLRFCFCSLRIFATWAARVFIRSTRIGHLFNASAGHRSEKGQAAETWVAEFVNWYNLEHRHSSIRFVTPASRHYGEDKLILEKRKEVYEEARQKYPSRWASRKTRTWEPIQEVTLNPSKHKQEASLGLKKSA